MVIDSMFCGLTIVRALVPPVLLWLVMGTPSITISGLLEAESEEPPRMRMLALPVGSPPWSLPSHPGWRLARRSCADVDGAGLHIVGSHDRHRSGGVRFLPNRIRSPPSRRAWWRSLHHDVEMSSTRDRHFHRVVAHVAYHEGGVRGHRDGEVAVNVCRGSVGGAFFHHGGTD